MAFLKNKRRVLGGMVFAPFKIWQVLGKKGVVLSEGKRGGNAEKIRVWEAQETGSKKFTPLCGSGGRVNGSGGRVTVSCGRVIVLSNQMKTSGYDFTPSNHSLTG